MRKKSLLIVAFVLAAVTIFISVAPAGNAVKIKRCYGDIDCDGYITLLDASIALEAAIKIYPRQLKGNDLKSADVNKSGAIDTADAREILRTVAKIKQKEYMESYDFTLDSAEFTYLCNKARVDEDTSSRILKTSSELCKVAEAAAEEFANKSGSALRRADGSFFYKALDEAGVKYNIADKFIQTGSYSMELTFEKMLETLQNKKTIFSRAYGQIGVGAYSRDGQTFYWCVIVTD